MLIPLERIEKSILVVRGQKVMLDADLADLYGVPTKRLNEQVRRNADRFPEDFLFQLTSKEKEEVVANCDHLAKLKFSPVLPYAFTEHGAIMAASVLNSPRAAEVSVYVVRAFVHLRAGESLCLYRAGDSDALNCLNSKRAIAVNIRIMKTFVNLREMIASNAELAQRLDELEQKYDHQFRVVFDAIRQMMKPEEKERKGIGFRVEERGRFICEAGSRPGAVF